jgi:hypothetical protein
MPKRLCLFAALALLPAFAQQDYLARARKLSTEYIGIDSHIDTIQRGLILH